MVDARTDLVCEIRVDDGLPALLDVLDQIAQAQPHQFEQRHGNTLPPGVGLDLLDQLGALGDRGNRGLLFQRRA